MNNNHTKRAAAMAAMTASTATATEQAAPNSDEKVFFLRPLTAAAAEVEEATTDTHTPIIGVLCIDVAQALANLHGPLVRSYISAAYVKFLQARGARVAPVWIGRERSYYENIMQHLNGMLLPGGAVFVDSEQSQQQGQLPNKCVRSAAWIVEIAMAQARTAHDGGDFPLWGTCLGFQLMLLHAAAFEKSRQRRHLRGGGGAEPAEAFVDFRERCARLDCSLPVQLAEGYEKSRLFGALDEELRLAMTSEPVVHHYHRYCIRRRALAAHFRGQKKADTEAQAEEEEGPWRVLATALDANEEEFITIVEHKDLPFYGVQFHPERAPYEGRLQAHADDPCVHSPAAIALADFLAEHFVAACRHSLNRFPSPAEAARHLIGNFRATSTDAATSGGGAKGAQPLHWCEVYAFNERPEYPRIMPD